MWTELTYEIPDGDKYNVLDVIVGLTERDASFDHAFGTEKRVEYEAEITPVEYYNENGEAPITEAARQWCEENYNRILNDTLNKLQL
jgi:hypothetical protein